MGAKAYKTITERCEGFITISAVEPLDNVTMLSSNPKINFTMETNKGIETFYAKTRHQWREWLKKNSQSKKEVCLIMYHKKSKTKSINHNEAVDEAMCFGWIDSLRNKRDVESFYQRFSPRKPNSNWSKRSKERIERLVEEGLMTEHGQKTVEIAKQKGKW